MAAIVATTTMDTYRRNQAALGGRIAASTSTLVANRLDPSDPDRGWASLLAELIALIRGGRAVSERLAMEFYRYLRDLEAAEGEPPEQPDIPFPTDAVVGSMIYTGPRMARAMLKRGDRRDVPARVGVMVGRSAMRHTLNGGRAALQASVEDDEAAWGWARITDGDPCEFCRMLATRGPVYKSRQTAGEGINRYHDGCGCSIVPVFWADVRAGSRGLPSGS